MLSKKWPVRVNPHRTMVETVDAPRRFLEADMVEIRVVLTPLRWELATDKAPSGAEPTADRRLIQAGERVYSEVRMVTIEARDSGAIFYLVRQLLVGLVREWLGVEI